MQNSKNTENNNNEANLKFNMLEEINHALTYYIPDESKSLEEIASDFYDIKKTKNQDEARAKIAESIKKINTGIGEYVSANQLVIIPAIKDIPPIFADTVPVPTLPDGPPPPDTTIPDPQTLESIGIITRAEHVDHIRPGCVYFWESFKKLGPIQERNNLIGSVVWVRFEGRTSWGISAASATILGKYCIYQADRYLVERWQYEEIWGQFQVLCGESGYTPAKSHGSFKLSAKWVKLNPNINRIGQEKIINCFWNTSGANDATSFANGYAQQDPFCIRGTDQLQ